MPITTGTTGDLKNFSLTCARAVIFLRLATSTMDSMCWRGKLKLSSSERKSEKKKKSKEIS